MAAIKNCKYAKNYVKLQNITQQSIEDDINFYNMQIDPYDIDYRYKDTSCRVGRPV